MISRSVILGADGNFLITDVIRKFFRRDRSNDPGRARSSREERASRERSRETRSSGSQTPDINTTPRQTQTVLSDRPRGRQLVSSERIESRRSRTQDGDTQTRGRPLVRQRMRTESVSVP